MLGTPGRAERIICLPRDILPSGSWGPWRRWAATQVAAWRRKRDMCLTSLSSTPSNLSPALPIGQIYTEASAKGAQEPILWYRAEPGVGKAWMRGNWHPHRAGKTPASKVYSNARCGCWLGLRGGLPEMSLAHTFKGSSIGVSLRVASVSVPQFPPPLCMVWAPEHIPGQLWRASPVWARLKEACHWPRDKPLSPLAALGLPRSPSG